MRQTPWVKAKRGGTGSSVPSDRIPPRPSSSGPTQHSSSGTGKKKQAGNDATAKGHGKSSEVLRIESIVKALHHSTAETTDPEGGCFCLARDHPLSPYVRICQSCGLIQCSLNLPYYACPFCSTALLSPDEKKALIADLEQQMADNLAREAEKRERAVEKAKKAAGDFPTLLDSIQQPQPQLPLQKDAGRDERPNLPPLAQETHKVMSLRGSHKVVISSSPAVSRPASRGPGEAKEQEKNKPRMVPKPNEEPKHATRAVDPSQPWENLLRQM
jgi:hypothetical protein